MLTHAWRLMENKPNLKSLMFGAYSREALMSLLRYNQHALLCLESVEEKVFPVLLHKHNCVELTELYWDFLLWPNETWNVAVWKFETKIDFFGKNKSSVSSVMLYPHSSCSDPGNLFRVYSYLPRLVRFKRTRVCWLRPSVQVWS